MRCHFHESKDDILFNFVSLGPRIEGLTSRKDLKKREPGIHNSSGRQVFLVDMHSIS
jgi:hypothetical protein